MVISQKLKQAMLNFVDELDEFLLMTEEQQDSFESDEDLKDQRQYMYDACIKKLNSKLLDLEESYDLKGPKEDV